MDISFSPQGTGACPLCKKQSRCVIRKNMSESVKDLHRGEQKPAEIVIYQCPVFTES